MLENHQYDGNGLYSFNTASEHYDWSLGTKITYRGRANEKPAWKVGPNLNQTGIITYVS